MDDLVDELAARAASSRGQRRRTRLAVAIYAACLVALLTFAAWLAPAEALGETVAPGARDGQVDPRG